MKGLCLVAEKMRLNMGVALSWHGLIIWARVLADRRRCQKYEINHKQKQKNIWRKWCGGGLSGKWRDI